MNRYQEFAIGHYLSSWGDDFTYEQIITALENDEGNEIWACEQYEGIPWQDLAVLVIDMVAMLESNFIAKERKQTPVKVHIKYKSYAYTVWPWGETGNPDDTKRFIFVIEYEDDPIESDEWFYTEDEAASEARRYIDALEEGADIEPDYDRPNYFEQSPEWWEERRKLGE